MKIHRTFAVLVLAAGIAGGALAARQTIGFDDDETIFLAVEQALQGARSLRGSDITVRSQEGFITLSGSARSVEDIAAAGRIARAVRGVTGVNNKLRVADRAPRV